MGVQKKPQLSRNLSEKYRPLRWKDGKEAFQVERAGPSHRHKGQHCFWTIKQKCNRKQLITGQILSHTNNDAKRPCFCLIPHVHTNSDAERPHFCLIPQSFFLLLWSLFQRKIFSDLSIAQYWTLQLKSSNCRRQKCLSHYLQDQGQPFFRSDLRLVINLVGSLVLSLTL